jgi:hypothetical protein
MLAGLPPAMAVVCACTLTGQISAPTAHAAKTLLAVGLATTFFI